MQEVPGPPRGRLFDAPDGRRWGAFATSPVSAAGVPIDPPITRSMIFVCEGGEQRSVDIGLSHADQDEMPLQELVRLRERAGEGRREGIGPAL